MKNWNVKFVAGNFAAVFLITLVGCASTGQQTSDKYDVTKLAVARSNNVSDYLIDKGVAAEKIHRYGSWSKKTDDFAPSRAVLLYSFNGSQSDLLMAISQN